MNDTDLRINSIFCPSATHAMVEELWYHILTSAFLVQLWNLSSSFQVAFTFLKQFTIYFSPPSISIYATSLYNLLFLIYWTFLPPEEQDLSTLQVLDYPNELLSSVWALRPPPPPPAVQTSPEKDREAKGSRFAKFLAAQHAENSPLKDQKHLITGKFLSKIWLVM